MVPMESWMWEELKIGWTWSLAGERGKSRDWKVPGKGQFARGRGVRVGGEKGGKGFHGCNGFIGKGNRECKRKFVEKGSKVFQEHPLTRRRLPKFWDPWGRKRWIENGRWEHRWGRTCSCSEADREGTFVKEPDSGLLKGIMGWNKRLSSGGLVEIWEKQTC